AREIHDTLAQGFTSIVTLLQAAQAELDADPPAARRHLDLAVRTARENLTEARGLVSAAVPGALEAATLADAVRRAAERFAEETGVAVEHVCLGEPRRLPAELEVVLLRGAQELLANVGKHAAARNAGVRLAFEPDAVALTVTDDGAGFDPSAAASDRYGLAMLRSRVGRLGGDVEVDSAHGADSRITVRLPA
ncbi:MAG TPA: sensor histidine kinase, partial [Pseudonocardia sp.]|nr:sensor histidine kinase [Pseudonocardia sp.]